MKRTFQIRRVVMRRFLFLVTFVAVFCSLASAEVPTTLSYQGVLTDAGGAVVPDGTYSVTFRLYTVSSGGSPIWEETQDVQVSKGIFNVALGTVNPLGSLDFDEIYYLGISVEGEAELSPRVELHSVPYSMNSGKVLGDNVFPASGKVGIGTTSPDGFLMIDGSFDPNEQVGINFIGYGDYASIYTNAAATTGKPAFGYNRGGVLRAITYVNTDNSWRLNVAGSVRLAVTQGGDVWKSSM